MPLAHTYPVSKCCLCGSERNRVTVANLQDNINISSQYRGSIIQCSDCNHAFLSPVFTTSDLHLAYEGYYTRSKDRLEIPSNASRDFFTFFTKYYQYRYIKKRTAKGIFLFALSLIVPFARFYLNRAVRFLEVPATIEKPRLLDIGCGRGDFLIRAESCGYLSSGIDFDPEAIKVSRLRGLNAVESRIDELPENDLYDVITLSHVIEHVYNPEDMLEAIFQRLKEKGYLYISTPNFNSAGRAVFGGSWKGYDVPRHMHFFTVNSLKALLINTGFSEVKQVYDFSQSIGIIKSSNRILESINRRRKGSFKLVSELIANQFMLSSKLEVAVFRCKK